VEYRRARSWGLYYFLNTHYPWDRSLKPIMVLIIDMQMISNSFKPSEAFRLTSLLDCVNAVKDLTAENCLQLNDKTEVLVIAPDDVVPMIKPSIGPLSSAVISG